MTILLTVLFSIMAVFLIWQFNLIRKANQLLGTQAPDTQSVDGAAHDAETRVYFFHAKHCGPCKKMMPLIDALGAEFPNLIKVDIGEHMQLARDFKIAGTPSLITVKQGLIADIKIGPSNEHWLRQQLALDSELD